MRMGNGESSIKSKFDNYVFYNYSIHIGVFNVIRYTLYSLNNDLVEWVINIPDKDINTDICSYKMDSDEVGT